jgi:hypothetical protein
MRTAAAMRMMSTNMTTKKAVKDMPQHLLPFGWSGRKFLESCGAKSPFRRCELPGGNLDSCTFADVGVIPGSGKAESISDRLPDARLAFSLALNMSSIPSRLAVLPLSRFEASFVARLINSARLVVLPRASASRTASMFKRGGRRLDGILSLIPGLWSTLSSGLWERVLKLESGVVTGDLSNARGGSRGAFSLKGYFGGESSANGMRTGEDFACSCGVSGRELDAIPAAIAALRALIELARGDFGLAYGSRSGLRIVVNVGFALLP